MKINYAGKNSTVTFVKGIHGSQRAMFRIVHRYVNILDTGDMVDTALISKIHSAVCVREARLP